MKKNKKNISIYLKAAREKSGISQMKLAKKLGYVSSQFVSDWERGNHLPPVGNLRKICRFIKADKDKAFGLFIAELNQRTYKKMSVEFRKS